MNIIERYNLAFDNYQKAVELKNIITESLETTACILIERKLGLQTDYVEFIGRGENKQYWFVYYDNHMIKGSICLTEEELISE